MNSIVDQIIAERKAGGGESDSNTVPVY